MKSTLNKEASLALKNIRAGWRVALFQPAAFAKFKVSIHQVFALVFLSIAISALVEFAESLPAPQFSQWGFATETTIVCVMLLVGYFIAVRNRKKELLPKFLVAAYSVLVVFSLLSIVLRLIYQFPSQWLAYIAWWAYTIWFFAALGFVILRLDGQGVARAVPVGGVLAAGFVLVFSLHSPMWFERQERGEPLKRLNAEAVFDSQFELLQESRRRLKTTRSGITELYFLGFAGDGSQDVFRREVQYIHNLFDDRFGTRGRSITLINNRETVASVPLATGSNLKRALKMLAGKMNRDKDVLFLYFTSHGSQKHELAVTLWPLGLNDVTPQQLKVALDEAGIRWRVLLVSACYSGGFIEPFRDDHTLVMTAASKDRQSFGCSNEREFTYFGEAVFKNHLSHQRRIIPALNEALESIRQRERNEKLEPSNPQIHVGRHVPDKLRQIERRLFREL